MRGSGREGLTPVAPSEQNHGGPAIFRCPGASGRRPPHLGGPFPSFYPLGAISGILFFNPSVLTSSAGRALGAHGVRFSPRPAECPACALRSLAGPGVPSGAHGPRGKPRARPARSRPLHLVFQQW